MADTTAYIVPGFAKIVHKLDCQSVVSSVSEKMGRPIVSAGRVRVSPGETVSLCASAFRARFDQRPLLMPRSQRV